MTDPKRSNEPKPGTRVSGFFVGLYHPAMPRHSLPLLTALVAVASLAAIAPAQFETPATTPASPATTRATSRPAGERVVTLPGVEADLAAKEVRVECEVLALDVPLEFVCVSRGGPEHETLLRTAALPSHVHAALLMVGLTPGTPASYDSDANKWRPSTGPAVALTCRWTDAAGQPRDEPVTALLRDRKTHAQMPATTSWLFAGSTLRDHRYLADPLGYVVSLVTFEHVPIDVPQVTSSANETLEWERNPDVAPAGGTRVVMVIRAK